MPKTWTNIMPTEPGVYWMIGSRMGRTRLVEICENGNITTALNLRTFPGRKEVPEGNWFYGPIKPPEFQI